MLRLFHHSVSTFARRVRIALLEKKIEHEAIELDMMNRAHRAPEYLALNPNGVVPTLTSAPTGLGNAKPAKCVARPG